MTVINNGSDNDSDDHYKYSTFTSLFIDYVDYCELHQ